MFFSEFKFLLPELYLSFLIVFLTISCIIFDNLPLFKGYKLDFVNLHIKATLLGLFFLMFILFNASSYSYVVCTHLLYGNIATAFIKMLLVFIFFSTFVVSSVYYRHNLRGYEFLILLLVVLLSMFLIVSSADFFPLFFSFEALSLSFYILVSYKRDSIFSTEGGLRYFILSAFTSILFAIGISFIYYVFGTTNFFSIALIGRLAQDSLLDNLFLFYGLIFILAALLFKLSSFPFHFWTPDVYHGSPILFTKVLATASKVAILTVLIKLLGDVFEFYFIMLAPYLLTSGVGSVLVGTVGSLFQFKLKRLLAYSTISNMGYILISLSLGTLDGYVAAYFYMFVYVLLNINLFNVVISFVRKFTGRVISNLSELSYLGTAYPLYSLIFSFALFSIAGIPPLAGFFGKFYIFYSLISQSEIFLVLFLVAMSIVSAGYYLRLVNFIYFSGVSNFAFYNKKFYLVSLIVSLIFISNLLFLLIAKPVLACVHFVVVSLLF